MQKPDAGKMSSAEQVWFARAIAGMIVSDGHVDQSELDFLREAISFLKDQTEVGNLMKIVKSNEAPKLQVMKMDPKQAFIILKYLAMLIVADGKLSVNEVTFFQYVGKRLGFSSAILTKLWKTARAQLEKTKPRAKILVGEDEYERPLLELTDTRCVIRNNRAVIPGALVSIHLEKPDEFGEHYISFSGKVVGQRQDKWDENNYLIRIEFQQKLADAHGVLQILHPERYQSKGDERLEATLSSLIGKYVACFGCGKDNLPFWKLRSRCMVTENNLFGIPKYIKPARDVDFCDYNLLEVTTCPHCGFSSNSMKLFKIPDAFDVPFDTGAFRKGWEEKIQPLKEKMQGMLEGFTSEERTLDQSLLSYDLGIATYEHLITTQKDEERPDYSRKIASFYMIQAEILMENGQRDKALANLQKAVDTLSPVFEELDGVSSLRACSLIFTILVFQKNYQKAGMYMKFMDRYNADETLEPGSAEFKTYMSCSMALQKTYEDREEYSFEKMSTFHVDKG